MPYKVVFDGKADDDLAAMPSADRKQVLRAICERLTAAPFSFGKPLRHSLSGMRSLRVGDWRIAYVVDDQTVTVSHITLRRDAYKGW
ncbi:MAG: type II toxin-antitoxin system RelE/ParE family toxin [Kiritimatiellaeota bacterium]|nr:type II toxin-antitoxin system RelE/ParE family toxin [Kiritimatiellota bacterium]